MLVCEVTDEMSIATLRVIFVVGMNLGRDVDVDADVQILELGIDQRVNTDAANAGLERAGGYRDAVADLQRSLLAIQGADLRVLDELHIAVTE